MGRLLGRPVVRSRPPSSPLDPGATDLALSRDGRWALMGFINEPGGGPFVGSIGDPVPVDELPGFPGGATPR